MISSCNACTQVQGASAEQAEKLTEWGLLQVVRSCRKANYGLSTLLAGYLRCVACAGSSLAGRERIQKPRLAYILLISRGATYKQEDGTS